MLLPPCPLGSVEGVKSQNVIIMISYKPSTNEVVIKMTDREKKITIEANLPISAAEAFNKQVQDSLEDMKTIQTIH